MASRNTDVTDGQRGPRQRQRRTRRRLSRNPAQRLVAALRRELPAVVELLEGTAVEELRIEHGETVFAVKRSLGTAEMSDADTPEATVEPRPTPLAAVPRDDSAPASADTWTMTAPCVGIFRAGIRPDAAPQTEVGAAVQSGQVLGYVEAMGMMNDVEASHAGRVTEILVGDGQPVEYGQPLFALNPEDGTAPVLPPE